MWGSGLRRRREVAEERGEEGTSGEGIGGKCVGEYGGVGPA